MRNKILTILLIFLGIISISSCGYHDYDLEPDDAFSKEIKIEFEDSVYYRGCDYSDRYGKEYEFQIKTKDPDLVKKFIEYVNNELNGQNEKITVYVSVNVFEGVSGLFSLSNYSEEELDYPDYNNFAYLRINHIREDHDEFWDDINLYSSITGIRKLEVPDKLQNGVNSSEIDWYDIFPDLEEVVVYDAVK